MVLLGFYIFILLVALPLGQVIRIPLSLNVDITPLDVLVGVGSVLWLFRVLLTKNMPTGKQWALFWLFIAVLLLSLVIQTFHLPIYQVSQGALYLIRYVCYGLLFFIVNSSSKNSKNIVQKLLLIGGGLLIVSGYLQFFLYPSLRNLIYAGWDEHFYRMFATFLDPNYFGMFLVGYMLLVVSFFLQQKEKKLRILFGTIGLITFTAIILSYSRTALVALLVGFVVLFWQKLFTRKIIIVGCSLFVIGIIVMSIVGRRAEGNDLLRLTSTNARIGDAKNALFIFSHSPLFGVGFNTYRFAQYRYRITNGSPTEEDHGSSGADSSVLFVMATSGIVGILAYLYYLSSHVSALRKEKVKLGLATLIAFFIGSFFVNILFYPSLMVWLWVVLGISENTSQ